MYICMFVDGKPVRDCVVIALAPPTGWFGQHCTAEWLKSVELLPQSDTKNVNILYQTNKVVIVLIIPEFRPDYHCVVKLR